MYNEEKERSLFGRRASKCIAQYRDAGTKKRESIINWHSATDYTADASLLGRARSPTTNGGKLPATRRWPNSPVSSKLIEQRPLTSLIYFGFKGRKSLSNTS